jgi:DNA-binding LytR/AlgR family response regulator
MRYMLDFTLDELERLINPHEFYRLNRQVIASFSAIRHFNPYFNGKLKVQLIPDFAEGVIISKDKAPLFKQWLNK